eukprot:1162023-Pelagomonas_calceolata.AAC.4
MQYASKDPLALYALSQNVIIWIAPSTLPQLRDFMDQDDVLGLAKFVHVLLQLSCPRRQVQLCKPSLPFPSLSACQCPAICNMVTERHKTLPEE